MNRQRGNGLIQPLMPETVIQRSKQKRRRFTSHPCNGQNNTCRNRAHTASQHNTQNHFPPWKTQREAVVKKIKDNKWGVSADGRTLTGPEGFTVDLSACAAGWSETEGLTDPTIKIGQTLPQSGTAAYGAYYGKGAEALFNWYGDKGAFKDSEGKTRKIRYINKDDGYDPAKTIPLVDELIDSEKVFAVQTLGTANTMKVYDKLNQRCVPDPYVMSGHPAWGDPVNHPWVWGLQLAYNTEAILWGGLLEKQFADRPEITVAALIMQNDFGKAYELGFNEFIKTSKLKINFVFERIEPTAPTITNQMTTLASKNPDVFIAEVAGTLCTQAVHASMVENKHGRIINIASRAWLGGPGQIPYSSAKAGVVGMTRALARELGSRGITVNCVAPGLVKTDFARALWEDEERLKRRCATTPLRRIGEPDEIAGAVAYLASDAAAYVTGQVNGGGTCPSTGAVLIASLAALALLPACLIRVEPAHEPARRKTRPKALPGVAVSCPAASALCLKVTARRSSCVGHLTYALRCRLCAAFMR